MKFGLVRRGYSATGGAEIFLSRFAEAVIAQGHDVALFTTRRWPEDQWQREMHRLPGSQSPRRFADALRRTRAVERCDVLFSFERLHRCDCYRAGDGLHKAWLERRAEHEPWLAGVLRRFSRTHRELLSLEAGLFRETGAGIVIANSFMVKKEIGRCYNYPAERIHVIHNGVPRATPPADRAPLRSAGRRALGLNADDFIVLFAGSGWERKGLRWAIEAVRMVPAVTLVVAGRGNPHTMPRSSRVIFLGPVGDMPRQLAAADAFLLPTLYDPFSNACLEALAAGLPVITTQDNGFAEIIEPGVEGDIIDRADNVNALAEALAGWSDAGRREAARPRLEARGAQFTIEENVRQTLEVLMQRGAT